MATLIPNGATAPPAVAPAPPPRALRGRLLAALLLQLAVATGGAVALAYGALPPFVVLFALPVAALLGYVLVQDVLDAHERANAELAGALQRATRRIDEFVVRERNFTRDLSHELRSPLTVIRVAADVLLADGELSAFGERSLARIKRAARDMEALFEATLILARADDVGLLEEDFVVNRVVVEEVDYARALHNNAEFEVRVVEDAQFALHAPPRVLAVMLANLLRNAFSHTSTGHVTVTVGADFVRVDDTGRGLAPDELEQALELSTRGSHGVGLTIVKRLSDRFGWPVVIDSTLGVGTSATIHFPHPQPV